VGSANTAWVPVLGDYRGIPLVGVPPGCFMMGSEEGDVDEKPVRRVCLSAYWIGQTEVTNAQYAACVSARACAPPRDRTAFDNPALADHPVTWVSWLDAAAFVEWIGAALPSGAQWEFAARGPQSWTYPWGDSPATCALANLERCTSGTSPAGAYPAGASWVGALDLAGNAWEWVADYYGRDYYATLTDGTLDPLGPPFGDMHNVRGSSWENEARYARAFYQGGNYPDYVTYVLGFRIAVPAGLGETQLSTPTPAGPPTPTPLGGGLGEIAFVSERDGNREIYVMSADGSNPRRLTNDRANDRDPAWSPDGMRLAFYSDRTGTADIYVMGADGGGLRNLTNHPANDYHPAWSPDGTRIAFNSERDGGSDIYVINADGSGLTRLTAPGTRSGGQVWSPDGTRIAFNSSRDGDDELYVMNADGSGQTRLTFSPGNDGFPAWSPDGAQIAFQSNRDGQFEVYVINADGSNLRRLTTAISNDWWPEWSADGQYIAFISDRDGVGAIYLMAADGSSPRRLTPLNSWSDSPAWRPAADRTHPGQLIAPLPALSVAFSATEPGATAPLAARIRGSEQVNIRSGPGTSYPVVLTASQNSSLDPLSLRNDWVYARVDGSYGWIRQDLLDYSGDLRSLPSPEAAGVSICDLPGGNTASTWAPVHWRLGCPVSREQSVLGTSQPFANGVMIYRSEPTRMIYVILGNNRWAVYDDDWFPGTPLACSGPYIASGFGQVYCDHPGVARALGPALNAERPGSIMFIQEFERGIIFGIEQVGTRILYADNAADF